MPKRAVVYARVSTEKQERHGWGLASQVEGCKRYAATYGLDVVAVLEDSISGAMLDRPALGKAWELFEAGAADALIVYGLDRLSRDIIGSALIRERLADLEIELHSATDGGLIEHEYGGNFQANARALIANEERKLIVSRFKRGRRQKAESGSAIGNGIPPYGYVYVHYEIDGKKHTRLEIVEHEAEIVRELFSAYLRGETTYRIAQRLNDRGVPPPSVRYAHTNRKTGNRWHRAVIYRILHHPVYAGTFHIFKVYHTRQNQQRERPPQECVAIDAPAMIDQGIWQAVQAKLALGSSEASRNTKREYLIGRRFVCGKCGKKMNGQGRLKSNRPNEERRYVCGGRYSYETPPEDRCDMLSYNASIVDPCIWQWVVTEVLDPERLVAGVRAMNATAEEKRADVLQRRRVLLEQRESVQQQLDVLLDLYLQRTFDVATLDRRKQKLEQQQAVLSSELAATEAELAVHSPSDADVDELVAITNALRDELQREDLDFATRRRIIELLDVHVAACVVDGVRYLDVSTRIDKERICIESQHSSILRLRVGARPK